MNPYGLIIVFAGFIVLYIGVKGNAKFVKAAFAKNGPVT